MVDIGIKELHKKTLVELLKEDTNYVIPFFQREYSWGKDDWTEFLEDTFMAEGRKGHFFGFMTFKIESNGDVSIIEGQQRLTTATILIAVARDILFSLEDDTWKELEKEYITSKDPLSPDNPSFPKLVLSELNKSFFQKQIQAVDKPENKIENISKVTDYNSSNQLIFGCYKFFYKELIEKIKDSPQKDKRDFLLKVLSLVLKNFVVITTEVTDSNVAFNIFSDT